VTSPSSRQADGHDRLSSVEIPQPIGDNPSRLYAVSSRRGHNSTLWSRLMRLSRSVAACCLVVLAVGCSPSGELAAQSQRPPAREPLGPFLVKPYLQHGDAPGLVAGGIIQVLWQTEDVDANWAVECRPGADRPWRPVSSPTAHRIGVEGVPPHRLYRAALVGLEPGGGFSYRVRRGGEIVFAAEGKARGRPASRRSSWSSAIAG
jgi:hypothetical protein